MQYPITLFQIVNFLLTACPPKKSINRSTVSLSNPTILLNSLYETSLPIWNAKDWTSFSNAAGF